MYCTYIVNDVDTLKQKLIYRE